MAQDSSFVRAPIDETVLEMLRTRAQESRSDAVIVVRDGETILDERFGHAQGPIEAMSATKSIVALAFGRLLADGRLESLDAPVHTFYPEWNQGRKAAITIRHLLTQRSGLQCEPRTTEIYRAPDFVQLALAAELVEDPGTRWRYNNKGTNLLAGLVERISGTRLDVLVGEEIFAPLGITEWSWSLDAAGNPHAMSGLQIEPADLVRIGQLMLNGGAWNGEQVLPEWFVVEAVSDQTTPPPPDPQALELAAIREHGYEHFGYGIHYGLLWWVAWEPTISVTDRLLDEWRRGGADEAFLEAMSSLRGLTGDELTTRLSAVMTEQEWAAHTVEKGLLDWDTLEWTNHGYSAEGYLGQFLVVVPEQKLVAVRMRRAPEGEFDERSIDSFRDFKSIVRRLVPSTE